MCLRGGWAELGQRTEHLVQLRALNESPSLDTMLCWSLGSLVPTQKRIPLFPMGNATPRTMRRTQHQGQHRHQGQWLSSAFIILKNQVETVMCDSGGHVHEEEFSQGSCTFRSNGRPWFCAAIFCQFLLPLMCSCYALFIFLVKCNTRGKKNFIQLKTFQSAFCVFPSQPV